MTRISPDGLRIAVDLPPGHGGFRLRLDCTLPLTGVTAIYGASGAGKTTLLRCISGLQAMPDGQLYFRQTPWQTGRQLVPTHRRKIAYVCQHASLFSHLSVRGNLAYAQRRAHKAYLARDAIVALFSLESLLDRPVADLSGGEHQRVILARALLSQPELLLLDEPLTGIDHAQRTALLPFIETLCAQHLLPIFYVSHDLGEIATLAHHIVHLADGQLIAQGPSETILPRLLAQQAAHTSPLAALEIENAYLRNALATVKRSAGISTIIPSVSETNANLTQADGN